MNYYKTKLEEQESIINIDYLKKTINIYSSRKAVIERLTKKLGQPTKIFTTQKSVSGASWNIPFVQKEKIRNALSKTYLIGQMK